MPEARGAVVGLAGAAALLALAALGLNGWQGYLAQQQLRQNEDSSRRQLRAYLGSETAQLAALPGGAGFALVHNIRNFGTTPGNRVNYGWASKVEEPVEGGLYPVEITALDTASGASLLPQATASYTDRLALTPGLDLAKAGRVLTYFGVIHYADVFGTAQVSRFCYVVTADTVATLRRGATAYATKCANGNDGT